MRAIKDKRGEVSVPKRSKIRHLHQFLNDNGIVRVGSILKISYVNKQNKHQVFFPKWKGCSKLIIKFSLARYAHGMRNTTLNQLRKMTCWTTNAN